MSELGLSRSITFNYPRHYLLEDHGAFDNNKHRSNYNNKITYRECPGRLVGSVLDY